MKRDSVGPIDPGDQGDYAIPPRPVRDAETIDMFSSADFAEGVRRKEFALDGHEARQKDRLRICRHYLATLIRDRLAVDPSATVSADDARAFCDAEGIERGPWMGSLFRGASWVSVGFVPSADPIQHATMIRTWRIRGRGSSGP